MYNAEVLANNVQVRSLKTYTQPLEVINILHQAPGKLGKWKVTLLAGKCYRCYLATIMASSR